MNGAVLEGDVTEVSVEIASAQKKIIEFSQLIVCGAAATADIEESIGFILKKIDGAFGDGSAEKIFAGRKVSFHDCINAVRFIISEINRADAKMAGIYGEYDVEDADDKR